MEFRGRWKQNNAEKDHNSKFNIASLLMGPGGHPSQHGMGGV